ncbi:MAG TPA: HAD-IA family hydrolase [Geobacteraceae bacterium]|nr:HAD-IA family hydrolase [Geobacteraceae bacterium]
MTDIKLIIFDLDGTLVDSLDDLTDATNFMLGSFGRRSLTSREVRLLVGQGAKRLVERAMPDATPDEVEQGVQLFLEYNDAHIVDKTRLYAGVKETLPRLGAYWRLGVVSNKYVAHCRKLLDVLEVGDYFTAVMGADSCPQRKPSPEPILKLMADCGVAAAEAVIVGDSENDILAGKGAGIVTVGCTWGYGDLSELIDADYRIDSFAEILDLPVISIGQQA